MSIWTIGPAALNTLGALVIFLGIVGALSRTDSRVARLLGRVTGQLRTLLRRRSSAEIHTGTVHLGSEATVSAHAQHSVGAVDRRTSIAQRLADVEVLVREEQAVANARAVAVGEQLRELTAELATGREEFVAALSAERVRVDMRFSEQARAGLGIAAVGAVLGFAGTAWDLVTTITT